jgi:uncharacterized SAM-binding protein YcdF (DUF218 family)
MDRSRERSRRRLGLLVAVTVLLAVLWLARTPLLVAIGGALVAEDALAPADVIVVSNANARAAALEAARLYADGVSRRLVMAEWVHEPVDAEVQRLGVPLLAVTELARAILERSGVPPAAITVLPGAASGTEDEVAAVSAYLRRTDGVRSLLWVGPRTHTARARWLLRDAVPPSVRVAVRSSSRDDFAVDGWWRSRDQSREVMTEYVRWVNSAVLGDAWRSRSSVARAAPAATVASGVDR